MDIKLREPGNPGCMTYVLGAVGNDSQKSC